MYNWRPLPEVFAKVDLLDNKLFPVVLVSIDSVQCGHDCCKLDIFVRPRTSDLKVAAAMLGGHGLDFSKKLGIDPKFILDAGANIGMSTLFFAQNFPNAKIIAVDADPANFAILKMNTMRYNNVFLENVGVWDKETKLKISVEEGESWATRVDEVDGEVWDINAVTIESLITKHKIPGFDLVKVDVEGAESKVFHPSKSNNLEWMQHVKVFSVEIHDTIHKDASATVSKAITALEKERRHFTVGELDVWQI